MAPDPQGWVLRGWWLGLNADLREEYFQEAPAPFRPALSLLVERGGEVEEDNFWWWRTVDKSGGAIVHQVVSLEGKTAIRFPAAGFRLEIFWLGSEEEGFTPRIKRGDFWGPLTPIPMGRGQKKAVQAWAHQVRPAILELARAAGIPLPAYLYVRVRTRAGRGGWKEAVRDIRVEVEDGE